MSALYTISFRSVRSHWLPRWFPFNHPTIVVKKETTWAEAHHRASYLTENGCWDVSVHTAADAASPEDGPA